MNYIINTQSKLNYHKKVQMRNLKKRKDHHYIQKLENNNGQSDIDLIRNTMGGRDMQNETEI